MISHEKEIGELEESVKRRKQVVAKQAIALSQGSRLRSQQETTTASTNDLKQPSITAADTNTTYVGRAVAWFSSVSDLTTLSAAQAAAQMRR